MGPVHCHLAGCYLPADIWVRYLRAQKETLNSWGSDEHVKTHHHPGYERRHHTPAGGGPLPCPSRKAWSRWAFLSTSIHALPIKCIMIPPAFLKKMYDDGLLEEKEREQYYDEKTKLSWPTGISPAPARFVQTPMHTATSVKMRKQFVARAVYQSTVP